MQSLVDATFSLATYAATSALTELQAALATESFEATHLAECAALMAVVQRDELPAIIADVRSRMAQEDAPSSEAQQQRQVERAVALGTRHCGNLQCTTVPPFGVAPPTRQVCSACRRIRYCSAKCQRADWREHKAACKALAKAAS